MQRIKNTYSIVAATVFALIVCAGAPESNLCAEEVKLFRYRLDNAYTEFLGFRDRLHRSWISLRSDLTDNELGVASTLHLGLKGSVYHSRLIEWYASGGLTLKRRRFSVETDAPVRIFDETLSNYDVGATALKGRSLSLRLSANRRTSVVDGDFIAGTNVTTHGSQATLSHVYSRINQNLTIMTNAYSSEGLVNNDEDRFQVRYQGLYRDSRFSSQGRAEYEDVDFITARRGYTGKSARWLNTLRLTSDGRNSASGGIDYYERSWSAANQYQQYSLTVASQARRDLRLAGSASTRKQEVDRETTNTDSFSASLTHQLYRSLTSNASIDLVSTDFNRGSEEELTRTLAFLYNKITRLGNLKTRFDHTKRRHEETLTESATLFRTEKASYTPGFPVVLGGISIDTSTIEVGNADSSGLFVYTPGIDYNISVNGNRTEILVEPFGAIQPGDSLVIMYTEILAAGESFDETTNRYGFSFTVLKHLMLRADRMNQDQSPILGSSGFLLDNSRITEYSVGWNGRNIHAHAEYRFSRSGRNPYKLRVVNAQWTKLLSRVTQISLGATYSITDFPDQFSSSIVRMVNGSLRYHPSRQMSLITRGSYTSQSGRRDDGHAWVFSALARYRIERLAFEFRTDFYDRVTDIVGADDRLNIQFKLRRSIK